jgi:Zn-dependent peptidase ImmA (M78 family)/DNA-binding XRE family transcriptional regulator
MISEGILAQGTDDRSVVIGNQLRKARELLGFSVDEVAALLEVSSEKVLAWEDERIEPRLAELERLAELYGRDLDYFLHETPEAIVRYEFRSGTGRSFGQISREARLAIGKFEELCRKAQEIEDFLRKKRVISIPEIAQNETPLELSARLRRILGIEERPVKEIKEEFIGMGIRVFELPVPAAEFAGLSSWDLRYGPRILVNARDLQGRRHFTLAHEFAHLICRHGASVCDIPTEGRSNQSQDERFADLFAVEFLLPRDPFKNDVMRLGISQTPTLQEVGKIAGKWRASVQATVYRLEDLGLIRPGHSRELLAKTQSERIRRRAAKTPSWERRLGRDYVKNALKVYQEGHISLGKLASYLGLPLRKALEVMEKGVTRD